MTVFRQFGSSPNSSVRVIIIFVLVWAVVVYVFVSKLNTQSNGETDVAAKRVNQALQLLEYSKQRNEELRQIINELLNDQVDKQIAQKFIRRLEYNLEQNAANDISDPAIEDGKNNGMAAIGYSLEAPSLEYEQLRRRIQRNIAEMWYYFSSELGKIRKRVAQSMPQMEETINSVLRLGAEHKRSLLSDMDHLRKVDGHEAWRQQEARELSDLVQLRLRYLQNPKDCDSARKLVCKLNKGCGLGCQLHHATYCLIVAYASERTMVLKSHGWRYHKGGWEKVFLPVSETCRYADVSGSINWPGKHDTLVVSLPIIDSLTPKPPYLPLAIPEDLMPRLTRFHGDPIVWWVGQLLKYLLRPQPNTREFLESSAAKLGWRKPIVGIHVRRTDKVGTEAAFHAIEEYMTHVEDYYLQQEINGTVIPRRVFIASDDARVIVEARKKYPQYEVLGDQEVARLAAVSTRYTDTALNGIILDIHLLSLCDYLVCTFSSQVCRIAYEIMQNLYPDAAHRFKSLDDIYYFGGQNAHYQQAVIAHVPRNHDELHLKPGDLVGIAGNHWDGFSRGKNIRTNHDGLFPSFKMNDKVETAKMPTYPDV